MTTIHLEAPTLRELFVAAGRALAEEMAGGHPPPSSGAYEVVQLEAPDRDTLLADWLNELRLRAERDQKIFTGFTIEHLAAHHPPHGITAGTEYGLVAGAEYVDVPAPVKPTTLHGTAVYERDGIVAADVLLDV